jgi:DNA-binding PadR family transcriptional regulator
MRDMEEIIADLTQELRRGTITVGVLSQLAGPQYGYSLLSLLAEKGLEVDAGTLYPLLRRLEKQGILESRWDTDEARPRKYYVLSAAGRDVYARLREEWRAVAAGMEKLLEEGEQGR